MARRMTDLRADLRQMRGKGRGHYGVSGDQTHNFRQAHAIGGGQMFDHGGVKRGPALPRLLHESREMRHAAGQKRLRGAAGLICAAQFALRHIHHAFSQMARGRPFAAQRRNQPFAAFLFCVIKYFRSPACAISGVAGFRGISHQRAQPGIAVQHIGARQLCLRQAAINLDQQFGNIGFGYRQPVGIIRERCICRGQDGMPAPGQYEKMRAAADHGNRLAR